MYHILLFYIFIYIENIGSNGKEYFPDHDIFYSRINVVVN